MLDLLLPRAPRLDLRRYPEHVPMEDEPEGEVAQDDLARFRLSLSQFWPADR